MPDWSNTAVPERVNIWTLAGSSLQNAASAQQPLSSGSQNNAANQAAYLPFVLPWRYPVQRVMWCNGGLTSGSVDVGIYTIGGGRLWSLGGVAQSPTNAVQYANAGIVLSPGRYYLGWAQSASGWFAGVAAPMGRPLGLYTQASAYPLPAQATFAAWGSMALPIVAFTTSPSGI